MVEKPGPAQPIEKPGSSAILGCRPGHPTEAGDRDTLLVAPGERFSESLA